VIHGLWYRVCEHRHGEGSSSTGSSRLSGPSNAFPDPSQCCRQKQRASGHYPSLGWPRWLFRSAPGRSLLLLHRWPCRLPASARLTLAGPPEVLAGASQQGARHIQMKVSSLPCALAQHPATLIAESRPHLHKRDPLPFAPADRSQHTHCRIATTTTHNCRASTPTTPPPSPPRRDHARYRYGVHRK
jgi:hypothetical protein